MKSFIIRLKENKFSNEISDSCVAQALHFNLQVEKFDAVTGEKAEEIFANDNIKKYHKSLKKDTPGVKGCAASHYLLWKKCAESAESCLILEHDAFMIRPLPKNLEAQFQDVCKLDWHNPYDATYDSLVSKDWGEQVIDYDLSWGYKKKSAPYGGYFRGAWAYVIKPHAAKKLIDQIKINGWVPADKQFGESILKLQTTESTIFRIHSVYNHKNIHELSLTRK